MKQFQVLQKLGEGAFSIVYKVKRISDGLEYALKKVKLGQLSFKEKENAVNEVRILASINHPNVIGYKEAFFEDSTSTLCIVMEYADGGDLLGKIKNHTKNRTNFPEQDIWRMFLQMATGLKGLHDLKICHRDLKCANMFISKGQIKIGDLNVSKVAKIGLMYTQTGTPYYASPEVWKDKPYDVKSDMWSLGCVLYEMCALRPPFMAPNMQGLFRKVTAGSYPEIPKMYSSDLAGVVKALLNVNPSLRPTCDQILGMPSVVKHSKDAELVKSMDQVLASGGLLGTILLPKNLNALSSRLPKPNYTPKPLQKNLSLPGPIGSEMRKIGSSHLARGALPTVPESPRVPESAASGEDTKMAYKKVDILRPKRPDQQCPVAPKNIPRYPRGENNGANLPALPQRKVGSVDGAKRLAEIYNNHYNKGIYARSPGYAKDKLLHYENNGKPPMPIMLKDERKHYISPNPMRQAGLAVIERPQHYIPIRPMKDRIIL